MFTFYSPPARATLANPTSRWFIAWIPRSRITSCIYWPEYRYRDPPGTKRHLRYR
jgi:hypothetical protein